MAKGSGNPASKRPSSRISKPYDVNNSFVKKMATKVTDFIPQRSWISKWFSTSQSEDIPDSTENTKELELEEDMQQPPPSKRPRIRMDVIHPPGTFSIQPRVKTVLNTYDPSKEQYSVHNTVSEDFLEPVMAGPSGIGCLISSTPGMQADIRTITSHRSDLNSLTSPTNNGATNGTDDNSESSESTSGCSSLIPQINRHEGSSNSFNSMFSSRKRFIEDKLTFTNHLQSPRSLFIDNSHRDTLSNRRPSFNASVMTNVMDRASPLSSPFYSGNTTFGGANAASLYKRSRSLFDNSSELQLKVPRRANVEVRPSNAAGIDSSGMSQTAKKILEALEHFSSPISDAKKIPVKTTNNLSSIMNKKRAREEVATPSARIGLRHLTRELNVPTVPDILKLRRRQKLQDTTVAARRIVSARSDPPPQDYRLRTEDGDSEKYRGKLKAKSKINLEEEKTVEPINLPNIPLPISTLPNFNFTLPPAPYTVNKTAKNKEDTFTFASPIKVTDAGKSLKSINNFTFSNPINAEDSNITDPKSSKMINIESVSSFTDHTTVSMPNFIWSGSSTAPRLKEKTKCTKDDVTGSITVARELKSGSVMDILSSKSDKIESNLTEESYPGLMSEKVLTEKTASTFTSDANIKSTQNNAESSNSINNLQSAADWECNECLIRNSNLDKQCTACKVSRPNPDDKSSPHLSMTNTIVKSKPIVNDCFGSQFKLSTDQWQCTACCVRNKQDDIKCAACSALKPGSDSAIQETITNFVKSQNSSFMDKFKPVEGSWECPGCLLRNSANVITCPCCSASKPTSTCRSSMKIDTIPQSTSQKLSTHSVENISQETSLINSEIMNKFKPGKDSWECPGCLVRNNNSVATCPCCSTVKPNTVESSSKTESISANNGFGDKFKKPEGAWNCDSCLVQNDSKHTQCVACQALKPDTVKSNELTSNSGSTLQFKFGMPPNTDGFKFGIDKADNQPKLDTAPLNGFKFGNAQQNNEAVQFTFGIPKEKDKTVSETSKTSSANNSGFQSNVKNMEKSDTKLDQQSKQNITFSILKNENSVATNEKEDTSIVSSATLTTPSFTFGTQKSEFNQPVLDKETQQISFATTVVETSKPVATTTDSTSTSISTTQSPSLTQNNTLDTKSNPIFSFGAPSSINASNNASTSTTTNCLPSFAQSAFTFPDSKTTIQKATLPTFGEILKPKPAVLSTNLSFGGNNISETISTSQSDKPSGSVNDTPASSLFPIVSSSTSLFNNNETKTTVVFSTDKPAFATTSSNPSGFAMIENKIPTFGNTESKPSIFGTSETKLPVFGNGEKTTPVFNAAGQTPASNPLPAFGTPSSATSSVFGSSNASVFGNNTSSSFGTATTPAIFSSTKASESNVPNPSLFTFGSTTTQAVQQSTGNGFNFSANSNPTATAQKPLFTFGNNANASPSSNLFGGGTFTNPAPANNPSFTFNASKQDTPAFGQSAVTTPMFGTPQANPQSQATSSFSSTLSSSTGFNFGSTAQAPASEGFNFGGVSSTSAPTGGFNFNPPTSTPTVTFDPNSRPSFNFTKGSAPTEFNAPPQTTKPAARKIKKAFRRCMR